MYALSLALCISSNVMLHMHISDLALAKEILGQFDVILIMEWLDDVEMTQYLDSVLGNNGRSHTR